MVRNIGLDAIRASAIILVMISHSQVNIEASTGLNIAGATLVAGFWGVELFFVLSGFLIGHILMEVTERGVTAGTIGRFLARRWFRTLPLYALTVGCMIALYGPPGGHYASLGWYATFTQWFWWREPPLGWFGVSWSLAIEEWAYLLLAGSLLVPVGTGRYGLLARVMVLATVPLLARLWFGNVPGWDEHFRKITLFRIDSIAIGVVLAWWSFHRHGAQDLLSRPWSLAWSLVTAVLAMAGLSVFVATAQETYFSRTLLFTCASAAVAILILSAFRLQRTVRLFDGPVAWVARISYCAYLVHSIIFDQIDGFLPPGPLNMAVGWGAVAMVGTASFHFLEQPILSHRPRQFPPAAMSPASVRRAASIPSSTMPPLG